MSEYHVEKCWDGTLAPPWYAIVGPGTGTPYDSKLYAGDEKQVEIMAECAEFGYLQSALRAQAVPEGALKSLLDFIREEPETRLSELDWLKGMASEYEKLIRMNPDDRDPDAEAEAILSVRRLHELLKPLSLSPEPETKENKNAKL